MTNAEIAGKLLVALQGFRASFNDSAQAFNSAGAELSERLTPELRPVVAALNSAVAVLKQVGPPIRAAIAATETLKPVPPAEDVLTITKSGSYPVSGYEKIVINNSGKTTLLTVELVGDETGDKVRAKLEYLGKNIKVTTKNLPIVLYDQVIQI